MPLPLSLQRNNIKRNETIMELTRTSSKESTEDVTADTSEKISDVLWL